MLCAWGHLSCERTPLRSLSHPPNSVWGLFMSLIFNKCVCVCVCVCVCERESGVCVCVWEREWCVCVCVSCAHPQMEYSHCTDFLSLTHTHTYAITHVHTHTHTHITMSIYSLIKIKKCHEILASDSLSETSFRSSGCDTKLCHASYSLVYITLSLLQMKWNRHERKGKREGL